MEVIILGSGDAHGVPRIGCDCEVCRNVLSPGSRNYRTSASLALRYGPSYARRLVLIDAAPELRLQATGLNLSHFDALLLTHAHTPHFLGLSALVRSQRELQHPFTLYAPAPVLDDVRQTFGFLWTDKTYRRVIRFQPTEEADLWELHIQALRVDHGIGGTAYGYLLSQERLRIAYIPDMLRPTAKLRQALTDLDLLILGAAHYYEGIETWKRSIMDIMAAQELIREVAPKQALLTHLSHTVNYDEISPRLPQGVRLAYDGLVVEVEE